MLRFIFKKGIERKPFFDYDYAIYFNLNRDISREEVEGKIRGVKNMHANGVATRDFSIAFYEPAFCPTQAFSIKDPEKLETSLLNMELEELKNSGIYVDNETKTYNPEYVLKLTAARKDIPLPEVRSRVIQLASDLYYKLDREKNMLSNFLLHFNDSEMSEIKPV